MFLNVFKGRKKAYLAIEVSLLCVMLVYAFVTIVNGSFSSFILFVLLSMVFLIRALENFMRKSNIILLAICVVASIVLYFKLPS
jgi:hypothetical protein